MKKIINKPDKEELENLYLIKKLSTRQIAKIFKVEKTTILNWLRKYKIPIRDSRKFAWEIREINPPIKEQLEDDYKILSLELIAGKYNVSVEAINVLFKKYKIRKRTLSEARNLALKESRGIPWNRGLTINDPRIEKLVKNLQEKQLKKMPQIKIKLSKIMKRDLAEGKRKVWNKGKKLSPEHVKKLSEAKKKLVSPEFIERMREIGLKAKPKYGLTKPESLMKKLLEKEKLTGGLVSQYPLRIGDIATKPDFAYPKYKIAIYCDGEFWHGGLHHIGQNLQNMKEGSRKEAIKRIMKKDAKQHYMLWSNGWTPLRFWQHEIEENPKWVIEQIKKNMFDKDYIKKREKQRKEYIAEIDEKGNIFLSKQ